MRVMRRQIGIGLGGCVATAALMFHTTPVHATTVPANDYEIAPSFSTLPEQAWFNELGQAALTNAVTGAVAGAVACAAIGTPSAAEAALVGGAAGALGGAAAYAVTSATDAFSAADNSSTSSSSSDNSSSDNSSSDNSSSDNSTGDNSSSDNSSDSASSDNTSTDSASSTSSGGLLAHFVSGEVESPVFQISDPALNALQSALRSAVVNVATLATTRSLD